MKNIFSAALINFVFVFGTAFGQSEKPRLVIKMGHSQDITQAVFSPNLKILATGGADKTVKLWSVDNSEELATLRGYSDLITAMEFSPDGQILAAADGAGTLKLWDVTSGLELKTLAGHSEQVTSVAFSPDGKILASGSTDKTIIFWDAAAGQKLKTLTGHSDAVSQIIFSADGKVLASGSADKTIKLWNAETGRALKTLAGHSSGVLSLVFGLDGKTLTSVDDARTVKVWDAATGSATKTLKGESEDILGASFNKSGKTLATTGGELEAIKIWDVATGKEIQTLHTGESITMFASFLVLPPVGEILVATNGRALKLWDIASGKGAEVLGGADSIENIGFSSDGSALVSVSSDKKVRLWRAGTNKEAKAYQVHSDSPVYAHVPVSLPVFSPDGNTMAFADANSQAVTVIDVATGAVAGYALPDLETESVAFSPDNKTLAVAALGTIKFLNKANGEELRKICCVPLSTHLLFSQDGKTLVVGGESDGANETRYNVGEIWDVEKGTKIKEFKGNAFPAKWLLNQSLAYSSDGTKIALGSCGKKQISEGLFSECEQAQIVIWDIATSRELTTIKLPTKEFGDKPAKLLAFSPDGKSIAFGKDFESLEVRDAASGQAVKFDKLPDWAARAFGRLTQTPNGKIIRASIEDNAVVWRDNENGSEIVSLIGADKNDWIVTTPDGRFDTNKSLDRIGGLHWVVNDEILKPLPLDIFMRQYYEPGLLQRALSGEQFKSLPSIADINRVQPKVAVKEIKPSANSDDSVDVTVAVESVTEEVVVSSKDKTKKKQLASGAYDLRLFRDGQLIGVSTRKKDSEDYMGNAPALAEKDKLAKTLINTEENKEWRRANDIFKLKAENVKTVAPDKVEYTFRNVRLARDGRKTATFTAYAFNADQVKSATASLKFTVPAAVADAPKEARAFVVSIGVNASENPLYNLRYAANDARNMQEIIGARLRADADKYSEVVSVPLVSDYDKDGKVTANAAQKAIIKGVFSMLAGNEKEVAPDVLASIPNRDKIKAVEPEDTLIITYAGHGYADGAGIFYLLPYDIGAETAKLTPDALRKMISSDELSLWMQDITASEMIMVIDACHSAAAVQGDGFKPGPMGSRGLGQLAYDKDMKILSATQANNVALESNNLQQGLLSFALLQDGIVDKRAFAKNGKQLFSAEWLAYAERRVPELYAEVRDGRRGIFVDGKAERGTAEVKISGERQSGLNLQRPSLFDFKRRSAKNILFDLP